MTDWDVAGAVARVRDDVEASWVAGHAESLELLERLVNLNTFADNIEGIDAERAMLRAPFEALGFRVEDVTADAIGAPRPRAAHLVASRGRGGPRVLLLGHLDTVFPPDDAFRELRRDGDLLRGPGVGDIKGGVVCVLAALRALERAGGLEGLTVTVVLNSDEEVGSHTSRDLIREHARRADWALGVEPAFHPPSESVEDHGTVQHVVRRKGCGRFSFRLTGVAAHSGGAHHLGVSAIEALARKIGDVHALTDRGRGVTTNVGVVQGGRSSNTVAPAASGEIDFRFQDAADGEATAARIREIVERPERVNPDVDTPVTGRVDAGGGVLWPPLEPTLASGRLSELVIRASAEWGIRAEGISRGGASDACHAAAVGTPAACGLGPVSQGIHTDAEHTSVAGLRRATEVLASVLATLGATAGR